MLELASGGGNNASHLKAHFQMTLVDVSSPMLRESQRINPECEHLVGDMRSLRLDRRVDSVFVHDAVDYLTNLDDLLAAMATAHLHLKPGTRRPRRRNARTALVPGGTRPVPGLES